jgi:hypothetical protein
MAYEGSQGGARQVVLNNRSGVVASGFIDPSGKILKGYDAFRGGEGKHLSEYVGREIADKILSGNQGPMKLSAGDLEVGGEGMRYAYDTMYPKMLEKMLRKMDPQHPGRGTVELRPHDWDEANGGRKDYLGTQEGAAYASPFHYFALTPTVKEAIAKGLPLFGRGGAVEAFLREKYGDEQ